MRRNTRTREFFAQIREKAQLGRAKTSQASDVSTTAVLDHYVAKFPSAQNAVDAVPGWNHAFPPEIGVSAGPAYLYNDNRIEWCIAQASPLSGRTVLELGPLEGMHTYMLAKAGAAHIDAIEANTLAYIRCLITKEILQIANASFLLGDFNLWLDNAPRHYDLVVASGVLYHSPDPIRLLELISRNADQFYIWTHYFDDKAMNEDDKRRAPFSGRVERRTFRDQSIDLHERSYFRAWRDPKFCGGLQDRHYWMTRDGILKVINALGFAATTAHDELGQPHGPSLSIFARRRP